LAGSKKVQQVLTDPGVLEHFLSDLPPSSLSEIRSTWMGMWDLSAPPTSPSLPSGIDRVLQNNACEHLVLKPQREGGGNNIYRSKIPEFLKTMPEEERKAWIVMELIQGPEEEEVKGIVMRDGQTRKSSIVSELGVFGWCLFGKLYLSCLRRRGG
jgi:glutathione synthase